MSEEQKQAQSESQQTAELLEEQEDQDVRAEGTEASEDLLTQKDEELRQLQDRILRLAAEMENTRKRLEREKSEGISYANESLLRELLPVVDNLERAIQHAAGEAEAQSLIEGVRMTHKMFMDVLNKFGCTPFESAGKTFDPNYHEAVMQKEDPEHSERMVLEEFQKGYTLKDRLLRPAMVVVSKGS